MDAVNRKFAASKVEGILALALTGYFPLFDQRWLEKVFSKHAKDLLSPMTKKDQLRAKSLIRKLSELNGLEKKRTWLLSGKHSDQILIVRSLLKLVEGKILDGDLLLH